MICTEQKRLIYQLQLLLLLLLHSFITFFIKVSTFTCYNQDCNRRVSDMYFVGFCWATNAVELADGPILCMKLGEVVRAGDLFRFVHQSAIAVAV
jgi:hypothetical protein